MWKYYGQKRPAFAKTPGHGQESVWDYPRPPRIKIDKRLVEVTFSDKKIASTKRAYRILETASPPTFYLPPEDVIWIYLTPSNGFSVCEWKGRATYWHLKSLPDLGAVGWSYAHPKTPFKVIKDYISFYPALVACFVNQEKVRPQAGKFYGGWVTDEIVGPFKGELGSEFW